MNSKDGPSIAIIDYDCGNFASVRNMLKKIGFEAAITSDSRVIARSDLLILPGVGAFDHGMSKLNETGLRNLLDQMVGDGVSVLGICLGAQLLFARSEEGNEPGLGWLDGDIRRFDNQRIGDLKIPHMGWSDTTSLAEDVLFRDLDSPRFYFVHSYHFHVDPPTQVLANAHHGYDFPAAVRKGNVAGVQFHPEKSHRFGMKLLSNFVHDWQERKD